MNTQVNFDKRYSSDSFELPKDEFDHLLETNYLDSIEERNETKFWIKQNLDNETI